MSRIRLFRRAAQTLYSPAVAGGLARAAGWRVGRRGSSIKRADVAGAGTMDRRTFNALLGSGLVAAATPLTLRGLAAAEPIKVGYVYLGPVGDSGWTYQHDVARKEADRPFWRRGEVE